MVTVEIEHIDVGALQELVDMGIDVQPTPHTLKTIQDKFVQKEHFKAAGVPLGDFAGVTNAAELAAVGRDEYILCVPVLATCICYKHSQTVFRCSTRLFAAF